MIKRKSLKEIMNKKETYVYGQKGSVEISETHNKESWPRECDTHKAN